MDGHAHAHGHKKGSSHGEGTPVGMGTRTCSSTTLDSNRGAGMTKPRDKGGATKSCSMEQ